MRHFARQSTFTRRLPVTRRAGQTLVGFLVVLVIIGILAAIIVPRVAGRHHQPGQPLTPRERSYQTACGVYEGQINQAIMMYRMDHSEQNPPSLDALSTYGVTNDMIHSPDCIFQYDPSTGIARNAAEGAQGYHGIVNPTSPEQIDQSNGTSPNAPQPGHGRRWQGQQPGGNDNQIQLPGGLHMPNPSGGMGSASGGDDSDQ